MTKILIVYFSGVGATKKVAEIIHSQVSKRCKTDIFSIEDNNSPGVCDYNALIIGTPVHHAAPAKAVMNYVDTIKQPKDEMPVFIYNTRGLCSLNTNRILAKKLREKNMVTVMDKEYKSLASDGVLIFPFIKWLFQFENNLEMKICKDCTFFRGLAEQEKMQSYIPSFRLGSIINAPNKFLGQSVTRKIYLHKDRCTKCKKCIKQCPYNAFSISQENYPVFDSRMCENCYRCIHHCPMQALSLNKRRIQKNYLCIKE